MQRTRRALALLLTLTMLFSLLPTTLAVHAADPEPVAPAALEVSAALPAYKIEGNSYAERAVDLVSRMTLAEKASQTAGYNSAAIPRLGIATYMWWNEALHGYNQEGWFGIQQDGSSYPSSYSMGASWDADLYYKEAEQIGAEIRERVKENRYNLTMFSPNINLARDPRWGRNDESYGEDPLLVGTMAASFVNGVEGKSQDGSTYKLTNANGEGMKQAGTTIKHYAANNSEKNRYTSGADDVTVREMREYYTRASRIVIDKADVSSVMMAYSSVSGIPISFSSYYMDTILRQSYGFSGYIVSDCDSVATSFNRNVHKNNPHTAANYTKGQAYANALANGLDLQCNAGETDSLGSYSDNHLSMIGEKTDKGLFTEAQFEVSAARLMTQRMQLGEFDADNKYATIGAAGLAAGNAGEYVHGVAGQTQERIDLADDLSRATIVLLKNDDDVLPITEEEINAAEEYNVAIIGPVAQSNFRGGYSSSLAHEDNLVTIEQAIKTAFADDTYYAPETVEKVNVNYYYGFSSAVNRNSFGSLKSEQIALDDVAEDLDLAIVAIGEGSGDSREDGDRTDINLKQAQIDMLEQVKAKNPKKLILVMETYGQVQMPDEVLDAADAILWSGFNGFRKGTGFGEAITGKNNPSGRMNATWLKDAINDTPEFFSYSLFPDDEGNGGRSYMYNVEETLYPFGYGLSYSDIDYAPVDGKTSILGAADKGGRVYTTVTKDTVMNVNFQMTNTNGVAGRQVAEVYVVSPGAGENDLPLKRLVGFDKVDVAANGTTEVNIPIKVTDFAFFNEDKDCYELPVGNWQIWVAKSSEFNEETDLCETFRITESQIREDPTIVTVKPTLASDAAKGITERVIFPLSADVNDNIILPNVGVTMANEKLYGTRVINNVPGKDIGVDAKAVIAYTKGTADGFTVPDTAKYVDRLEAGKEADDLPMVGTKFILPEDYIVSFESSNANVVEVIAGQLVMQAPGTATITATVTGPSGESASTEFAVCVTGSDALTALSVGGNEVEEFDAKIYDYFVDLPEGFTADDPAALVKAEAVDGAKVEYSTDGENFAEAEDGINPAAVPGMVYIKVSGDDIAELTYSVMFGDVDNGCEHNKVVNKVVAPTCLTDGYTSYVCTKCYKLFKEDIIPALGHTFVNGRCVRCYVKDPDVQPVDANFIKVDTVVPGKKYVVVAKASGKALVNAGAAILGEDVTVADDTITSEVSPDMVWSFAENGTGYFLSCGGDGILSHGAGSSSMFGGGGNVSLVTNAFTAATVGNNAADATWALQNGSLVSKSAGGYFSTGYVPVFNDETSLFEGASAMDFSWGGGVSALTTLINNNPFEFYEVFSTAIKKTVEVNNAGYVTAVVYTEGYIDVTSVKDLLTLDVADFEIPGQTIYSVFAEEGKFQLNVVPFKADEVVVNYTGSLDLDLDVDGDYEVAPAKVLRPKVSYTVQTLDDPLHAGPNICIDPESPTGYTVKFLFKAPEKAAIAIMEGRTVTGWTFEDVTSVQFNGDLALRNANDYTDTVSKQPAEYEPGYMRAGSIQGEMTKLTEGEWEGYWYYELPLAAGANQYWFYCNGSTAKWYPDPANPAVWGPGCTETELDGVYTRRAYNSLYVPYDEVQDYELLELRAKYETPRTDEYAGTLTWEVIEPDFAEEGKRDGLTRRISVYLPAGYDENREEPYKTIYMTPAYDQDEADWFGIGSCQNVMDNLIAYGDVEPNAIIVSCIAARNNQFLGLQDTDEDGLWNFEGLFDYLIPYIEENYNVSKEGKDRAIGGHYQTAGSLINFLGKTGGRSVDEFGYYLMVSTGKGADIQDAPGVENACYFFSNGSTERYLDMGTLPQTGARFIYYQPPGGHDFNCWDQAVREYFKALWNDDAWKMPMYDIDFTKPASANRYDVINKASAAIQDGVGLNMPTTRDAFESAARKDVIEIPVEGDNWTATVEFANTRAGFAWGAPSDYFGFFVADDYDTCFGVRGTSASSLGYLYADGAASVGNITAPGAALNTPLYYRIVKDGSKYTAYVSANDFDYTEVAVLEDAEIEGTKLILDAYSTGFMANATFTVKYLSYAPACDHDVQTEVVKPTCTEDGYTIYSCELCGKSYKGDIVPAQHKKWENDSGIETYPTCTEAGFISYVCAECGEIFTTPGRSALGHDWIRGNVVAPTCTVGGYTEYSCSRCDATKQDDRTSAVGHVWDDGEVTGEPGDNTFGEYTYHCTAEGCDATKVVAILPVNVELEEGPNVFADPESPTGYTVKFLYKNETAKSVTFAGDIGLKNDADLTDNTQYTPFEYRPGLMRSGSFTDAMTELADGYWYYAVPMAAGANQYWFYVDGNTNYMVPDPANPPIWSPASAANKNAYNAVYVPYDEKQDYEPLKLRVAENPRNGSYITPTIEQINEDAATYKMGTWSYVPVEIGNTTYYLGVYLPYGYDPDRAEPYKTIYICHGGGQDESDWMGIGSVQNIMDNLVAEGKAEPAVIISPNNNGMMGTNYANLFDVVIPFVEENYNVSTDKMDRAFGGLSMGSMATQSIINLDTDAEKFGYYGPWSGGCSVSATAKGIEYAHILMAGGHSDFGNPSESSVISLANQGVFIKYIGVTGAHDFNTWCQMFRIWLTDYIWKPATVGDTALIDELLDGPIVVADENSPTGYTGKFIYFDDSGKQVYFCGDLMLSNDADPTDKKVYTPFEYKPGLMRRGGSQFKEPMTNLGNGYWYYELPLAAGANQYWFNVDGNRRMLPDPLNHPQWSPASNWDTKDAYNAIYVPYDEKQDYEPTKARTIENPREDQDNGTWSYVAYDLPNQANCYMGVYLPYGYDAEREEPYKSIYVLHGAGQDESDWLGIGSVQNIVDNLYADGDIEDAPILFVVRNNRVGAGNLEATFAFAEANYNVSTDRMDRAICGLSMGGMMTNNVIRDDKSREEPSFGYYGLFSGGAPSNALTSKYLYDMFLYVGNGKQESFMNTKSYTDAKANFYYTQKSGAHDFNTWCQLFTEFVRDFAFQPTKFYTPGPIVVKDEESPTGYTGRFIYFDDQAEQVYFCGDLMLSNDADPSDTTVYTPFEYKPGLMRRGGAQFKEPMVNLGDGYWFYELPLAAGANQYWFNVDNGSRMLPDPENHPQWSPASNWNTKNAYNAIYVPYDEKQDYEPTKARTIENPRTRQNNGTWSYVPYTLNGRTFYMGVYLPYGYDENREEPYKSVYVLHGGGQDESDWLGIGSVQNIVDNLYADGELEDAPILIVPGTGSNRMRTGNLEATFAFVEENYNVSTDRMDRAICGLSMGAMTINSIIGDDKNRDEPTFGYYGPFSGGAPSNALTSKYLADMFIYIGNGKQENRMNMSAWESSRANYYYTQKSGAHDFNTWCQLFTEFIRDFAFQPAKFYKLGPTVIKDANSPTGYVVRFIYHNPDAETVTFAGDIGLRNYADPTDQTQYSPYDYVPDGYYDFDEDGVETPVCMMRSGAFTDAMVDLGDGYWFYELPLAAGANQYWFYVDGNTNYMVPDPANHPQWSPNSDWDKKNAYNAVYVPYDAKQGNELMKARTAELPRTDGKTGTWSYVEFTEGEYIGVYLPYGYDPERAEPYKTIYMQHGGGQDESDWMGIGSVQKIMDNLAAEGRTEPAVIITTDSNDLGWAMWGSGSTFTGLYDVIIPFVEENYNVSEKAEDRAFAGLSMGSMVAQSLINFDASQFGYFGPWSGGASVNASAPNLQHTHILFAGGRYDFGNPGSRTADALAEQGFFTKYIEVAGAHDFNTWCQLFRIFCEDYLWNPGAFGDTIYDDMEYVRSAMEAAREAKAAAEAAKAAAEAAAAEAADDKAAAEAAQAAAEAAQAAAEAAQAAAEEAQAAAEASETAAAKSAADAAEKAAEAAQAAADAAAAQAAAQGAQAAAEAAQAAAETAQAAAEAAEAEAAADKEAAEAAKAAAEAAKTAAEKAKADAEAAKTAAEAADADAAQKAADAARSAAAAAQSESKAAAAQAAAQAAQAAAEAAKAAAEAAEANADADAEAAAAAKAAAEEAQAAAEAAKAAAENSNKEAAEQAAAAARDAAKAASQAAAAAQSAAEAAKAEQAAKAAQAAAEQAKADAEQAQAEADAAKAAAEEAAADAAADKTAAEAARAAAELAQSRADVAKAAAEAAQAAAEKADERAAANAAKTAADAAKTAADAAEAAKAQAAAQIAQSRAEAAQKAAEDAKAKADAAASKGEDFADEAKAAKEAADKAQAAAEDARKAADASAEAAKNNNAAAAEAAKSAAEQAAIVADALKEVAAAKAEAAEILKQVKEAELGAAKAYALTKLALAANAANADEEIVEAAEAAIEAAENKEAVNKALDDAIEAMKNVPVVVCPSEPYTDAPAKDNWAHEGIDYCIDKGYMNGTSETIFNPNGDVTRAQLVTILYRVVDEPDVEFKGTFTDVPAGQWYSDAIEWAAANDIVNGVGDGKFNPMGKITREQIAAILYRYSDSPAVSGDLSAFPDGATASTYAVDALVWATGEGLINGVKSGDVTNLAPKATATRAQIASIIMRFLDGSYDCK